METENHVWKVLDENPFSQRNSSKQKKGQNLKTVSFSAHFVAVILSSVLIIIGITWLSSVLVVIVSGKLLGFTIFFGIPPLILCTLITSAMYIVYWPLAIITKGFWSLAKGKNRYRTFQIILGAILFAVAVATTVIIVVNLGRNISFEYKSTETKIIIDEGNICISEAEYCEKY